VNNQLAETFEAQEVGEGEEAQSAPAERNYEAEAKQQGWTPKDQFKGDASHWIDAETFVKRGEELAPFLKKKNHILEREIAQLKRDFKRELSRLSERDQATYDRAMADLQARRIEAVEVGDVAAFTKLDKDAEDLRKSLDSKAPQTAADAAEALDAWTDENPWYELGGMAAATEAQARARAYADRLADQNADKAKDMAPSEFYAFIAEKVMTKFGEQLKEKKPQRQAVNPVSGATPPRARGGKAFGDLPSDAQAMAHRLVKKGILKSTDDYVKTYQW
jgi:hypothetical protein